MSHITVLLNRLQEMNDRLQRENVELRLKNDGLQWALTSISGSLTTAVPTPMPIIENVLAVAPIAIRIRKKTGFKLKVCRTCNNLFTPSHGRQVFCRNTPCPSFRFPGARPLKRLTRTTIPADIQLDRSGGT